jgi:hypothetical protein
MLILVESAGEDVEEDYLSDSVDYDEQVETLPSSGEIDPFVVVVFDHHQRPFPEVGVDSIVGRRRESMISDD